MALYEDLKKKAKDTFETIADISVETYKIAEERTRILAKRAKLNAEITREKALIRRLKGEIGGKYYDLHKDAPEEELKKACDDITDSIARIGVHKKEIEELKKSVTSYDAETEPESCEDAECCDCSPEPEPEPEEENKTEE